MERTEPKPFKAAMLGQNRSALSNLKEQFQKVCARKKVVLKCGFTLRIGNRDQKLIRKNASFGEVWRKRGNITYIGYNIGESSDFQNFIPSSLM